jgi:hypothetical protein
MAIGGSGKGIQIVVGTDYNDRDLKRAQRDLDRLKGQAAKTAGPMAKLGNTLRANVGPAFAMAAAAAGALAVKFAVDGVRAAAEEEAALAKLSTALENVGQGFAETQVNTFIDDLQRATGVADDQLRPAFQQLVTATRDASEAQDLLSLALDISAGSGRSLESVSLALAKAAGGQTTALRRLGVPLSDAAVKSGDLNAITAELADAFGGQAAVAASTFQGQLQRLSVAFSEVQESFGTGFLDALGDTNDGTNGLMDSLERLEPVAYSLGESIGTLAKFMADLEKNTGLVLPVIKGLTDLMGPTTDAILTAYRVFGQGEDPMDAFKAQMLGITNETEAAEQATGAYWESVLKATGAKKDSLSPTEEMITQLEEEADAAQRAAEEFDKLAGAVSRTGAVMAYEAAMDGLRKTIEENGRQASIYTKKGREVVDAHVAMAKEAGNVAEGMTSQSQQVGVARDALNNLETQLGNTKMDPATQAALLGPFQGLIDDLRESGVDVDALQRKLDRLKSKTIDVTVKTTTVGGRPPGVSAEEWYGTAVGGQVPTHFATGGSAKGMDTIPAMLTPGEFVIRRQAVKQFGTDLFSQLNRGINPLAGMTPTGAGRGGGLQIGTINVQSAPGERAETSLPRALRRAAFLAGVNG